MLLGELEDFCLLKQWISPRFHSPPGWHFRGRAHLLLLSLQVLWNMFTYLYHSSPQRTKRSMPRQYCGQAKWEHLLMSGGLETTQRFVLPMDWDQNDPGEALWLRREGERDLGMLLNALTCKEIINKRARDWWFFLMYQYWNGRTVLCLLLCLRCDFVFHASCRQLSPCICIQGGCSKPKSIRVSSVFFPILLSSIAAKKFRGLGLFLGK